MWQQFYAKYRDKGFELVAVACDVQGSRRAEPWVEKAKATFTTLIDSENRLAARFGFNFIPLTLWVDETGRVVRGPKLTDIRRDAQRAELVRWIEDGAVADAGGSSSPLTGAEMDARLRVQYASRLLRDGDSTAALAHLQKALTDDPDNWLIRKQIWAVAHPERFYDGPVDYAWQKRQLELERSTDSPSAP